MGGSPVRRPSGCRSNDRPARLAPPGSAAPIWLGASDPARFAVDALTLFAAMGRGSAAVLPLTLRAAARNPATAGPELAAVSTFGYLGLFLASPAIGVLAEATSLRSALLLVGAACLVAAAFASRLGPDSSAAG